MRMFALSRDCCGIAVYFGKEKSRTRLGKYWKSDEKLTNLLAEVYKGRFIPIAKSQRMNGASRRVAPFSRRHLSICLIIRRDNHLCIFYQHQIDSRDNRRMQESIYARDLHVTAYNLSEKRYACNMNWPEGYIIIQKYSVIDTHRLKRHAVLFQSIFNYLHFLFSCHQSATLSKNCGPHSRAVIDVDVKSMTEDWNAL